MDVCSPCSAGLSVPLAHQAFRFLFGSGPSKPGTSGGLRADISDVSRAATSKYRLPLTEDYRAQWVTGSSQATPPRPNYPGTATVRRRTSRYACRSTSPAPFAYAASSDASRFRNALHSLSVRLASSAMSSRRLSPCAVNV